MAWLIEAEVPASARDCEARETAELASPKALLLARPAGVYTCARLAAGPWGTNADAVQDALVVWPFHLVRLATGLKAPDINKTELMQRQTTDMVAHVASLASRGDNSGAQSDWMVTVLWWTRVEDGADMISVLLCPMPQPRLQGAAALVYGDRRANASCKHSQWVSDRVPIEQHARQVEAAVGITFQEVVLSQVVMDDAGVMCDRLLLEGSVSNFFVVRDGAVVTAQADVLLGSTRKLVLNACGDLGIPVILAPPRLSERETWQAAFVTSAVRLVMEIETLVWEEEGGSSTPATRHQFSLAPAKSDVPQRIREQILAQRMYLPSESQA